MSQSERERALRKLVAQWRDGGRWISAVDDETQKAYNYCADELEALLAAALDTPQEPTPAAPPDPEPPICEDHYDCGTCSKHNDWWTRKLVAEALAAATPRPALSPPLLTKEQFWNALEFTRDSSIDVNKTVDNLNAALATPAPREGA